MDRGRQRRRDHSRGLAVGLLRATTVVLALLCRSLQAGARVYEWFDQACVFVKMKLRDLELFQKGT